MDLFVELFPCLAAVGAVLLLGELTDVAGLAMQCACHAALGIGFACWWWRLVRYVIQKLGDEVAESTIILYAVSLSQQIEALLHVEQLKFGE